MGKIFWGLIFVLLDFNVGRFDIIPDFVGYVFIALVIVGIVIMGVLDI